MLASLPTISTSLQPRRDLPRSWAPTRCARTPIVPPTEIPGGMDYETCFWRTAHAFREAAEVTGSHGVKFVWEFEPGFLFNKPSEVVRMAYTVGSPELRRAVRLLPRPHVRGGRRAADGREGNAARRRGAVRPHADRQDQARPLHRLATRRCTTTTPAPMRRSARACSTSEPSSRRSSTPATPTSGGRSTCASGPARWKPPAPAKTFMDKLVAKYGEVTGGRSQFSDSVLSDA